MTNNEQTAINVLIRSIFEH